MKRHKGRRRVDTSFKTEPKTTGVEQVAEDKNTLAIQGSVYTYVLQRKTPPILQAFATESLEYSLRDILEDVQFTEWLTTAVGDNGVVIRKEDMLLIPALKALRQGWIQQSSDYLWAIKEYPGMIDRLATIGMGLMYCADKTDQ